MPSPRHRGLTTMRTLLLLFFRHSAKSLNAQEEHVATSPQLVTRLHLPHAIVVRLRSRKSNVVILTPESAGTIDVCAVALSVGFSIQDEVMDVARSAPQGAHYHVDVIYLLP